MGNAFTTDATEVCYASGASETSTTCDVPSWTVVLDLSPEAVAWYARRQLLRARAARIRHALKVRR